MIGAPSRCAVSVLKTLAQDLTALGAALVAVTGDALLDPLLAKVVRDRVTARVVDGIQTLLCHGAGFWPVGWWRA